MKETTVTVNLFALFAIFISIWMAASHSSDVRNNATIQLLTDSHEKQIQQMESTHEKEIKELRSQTADNLIVAYENLQSAMDKLDDDLTKYKEENAEYVEIVKMFDLFAANINNGFVDLLALEYLRNTGKVNYITPPYWDRRSRRLQAQQ